MVERIRRIIINKNRGWRGLAELSCRDIDNEEIAKRIFSFSQPLWDDMQAGRIVIQDSEQYYVLYFKDAILLPKGQRSVLLKNFTAEVYEIHKIQKANWLATVDLNDFNSVKHFIKNRNNHTTSDWNCIGIRVIPEI
jgi:hypothetical protein